MEEGQVMLRTKDGEIHGFTCPDTFITFASESDLHLYHTRSSTYHVVRTLRATVRERGMEEKQVRSLFTPASMVYEYGQIHNPRLKVVDDYVMEKGLYRCKLKLQDTTSSSKPRTMYFTVGTSIGKQEAKGEEGTQASKHSKT